MRLPCVWGPLSGLWPGHLARAQDGGTGDVAVHAMDIVVVAGTALFSAVLG